MATRPTVTMIFTRRQIDRVASILESCGFTDDAKGFRDAADDSKWWACIRCRDNPVRIRGAACEECLDDRDDWLDQLIDSEPAPEDTL